MSRTVLVTGAAVRIGRALVEALAAQGWDTVVHYHRSRKEAETLCDAVRAGGRHAWPVAADLSLPDGPDRLFDAAQVAAGPLDALVNNAADFARQPLACAAPADFDRFWRLNALAPIRLVQRLHAHLTARTARGCAVNLLDQRIAGAAVGAVPYLLSKRALEAFTLAAARELAPVLRINAVAPGAVLCPADAAAREPAGPFPTGTRPTPAQIAAAVCFLLDAAAITGQILFVDSGQHLHA